jgi:glycosyltransferase involved in cell wall biosynthesis
LFEEHGGTIPLDAVVARFHGALTLKLLRQKNTGPAAARNRAASAAKGESLAFTDDDCAPAPNWLQALEAQFAASPDCVVGAQTLNTLLISYLISYYNAIPHDGLCTKSRNDDAVGGSMTAHDLASR